MLYREQSGAVPPHVLAAYRYVTEIRRSRAAACSQWDWIDRSTWTRPNMQMQMARERENEGGAVGWKRDLERER